LVASTLEQRWNDAAQRVLDLKAEFASFKHQTLRANTAEQKQQILQLASNFPRLWTAPTTAARDRKRMLRLLIKDITVVEGPEPKLVRLQIRWQAGARETVEINCRQTVPMLYSGETFVDQIRSLTSQHDDGEIVELLNIDGLTSSTGKRFTVSIINWIRFKHLISTRASEAGKPTVNQVSENTTSTSRLCGNGSLPPPAHIFVPKSNLSEVQYEAILPRRSASQCHRFAE
jgi:hypothetical protein